MMPAESPEPASATRLKNLLEVAGLFLRLGLTAFGGPVAHIAMFEHEVVRRRRWLTSAEFLDLLGATNLIPGPNSTELAIHIGHRRAGWPGLVTAGVCFILPATLLVAAIASLYVRYGELPQAEALLYGVKPVIIAIVLQALFGLGRTAIKTMRLALLAVFAVALSVAGVHELLVLFGVAALQVPWSSRPPAGAPVSCLLPLSPALAALAGTGVTAAAAASSGFSLGALFLFFLKVGSVLFGSGYVLLAFLRADLVERWHWLTEAQLIDAIAVGQITPGPVFTTATFIGYILAGGGGAALATIGIFLPAFFFVAISGPLIPRLRRSPATAAFLDGLNVASLALMAVVTWQLARVALLDLPTLLLALLSAAVLVRLRINSAWLVLLGGATGLLLK